MLFDFHRRVWLLLLDEIVVDGRRDEVVLEHLLGREDLAADVTLEAAGLEVDDLDVRLQRGLLGEAAFAHLALVHFLLFVS